MGSAQEKSRSVALRGAFSLLSFSFIINYYYFPKQLGQCQAEQKAPGARGRAVHRHAWGGRTQGARCAHGLEAWGDPTRVGGVHMCRACKLQGVHACESCRGCMQAGGACAQDVHAGGACMQGVCALRVCNAEHTSRVCMRGSPQGRIGPRLCLHTNTQLGTTSLGHVPARGTVWAHPAPSGSSFWGPKYQGLDEASQAGGADGGCWWILHLK